MNTVICIISNILNLNNDQLPENLLYGKRNLDTSILDTTNTYLIETESFDTLFMLCSPDVMALALTLLHFCFVLFLTLLSCFLGFHFILFYFVFCFQVYHNIYM